MRCTFKNVDNSANLEDKKDVIIAVKVKGGIALSIRTRMVHPTSIVHRSQNLVSQIVSWTICQGLGQDGVKFEIAETNAQAKARLAKNKYIAFF